MLKNTLFILAMLGFVFTSCERCADCSCTNSITYTFGDDVDQPSKDLIQTTSEAALADTYPEVSEEVCEGRKGKFEDAKDDFEGDSETVTFENPGATEYSYVFTRSCACSDK